MSTHSTDVTLLWLLDHSKSLTRDQIVCMPPRSLELDDVCMVVDWQDLEPDEDVTPEPARRGLTASFGVPSIQDTISNLEEQVVNPSHELKLRAIDFYSDHDAFIEVSDAR